MPFSQATAMESNSLVLRWSMILLTIGEVVMLIAIALGDVEVLANRQSPLGSRIYRLSDLSDRGCLSLGQQLSGVVSGLAKEQVDANTISYACLMGTRPASVAWALSSLDSVRHGWEDVMQQVDVVGAYSTALVGMDVPMEATAVDAIGRWALFLRVVASLAVLGRLIMFATRCCASSPYYPRVPWLPFLVLLLGTARVISVRAGPPLGLAADGIVLYTATLGGFVLLGQSVEWLMCGCKRSEKPKED